MYLEAVDLDPLNLNNLANLAGVTDQPDIGRTLIETMKQINPESSRIPASAGWLEWSLGNFEEALLYTDQMRRPWVLRACALHALGRFSEANVQLDELQQLAEPSPWSIADVYACWNNKERAFEWLERAYDEHDPSLVGLRRNTTMLGLHDDPRWEALLQKLGLSDEHAEKLGL